MLDAHIDPEGYGQTTPFGRPVRICECCDGLIHPGDQSLRVHVTDALIHAECWEDYAADRVNELTARIDEDGEE